MKSNGYKKGFKGIGYTYERLKRDISDLQERFNFLDVYTIGESVQNRKIYILKFGQGPRKIFICGGTHACEWITVPILMKWTRDVCQINSQDLFERATIHILPMLNPDGIQLQIKGLEPEGKNHNKLVKWNNGSTDFSKWKANINGVDLNRNFNAGWKEAKKIEKEAGITGPWLELYGGEYPESERETQVLANYTMDQNFDLVLSYHTQGQEIYWNYNGIHVDGAKEMGEEFEKASGYALSQPEASASYAGYKDWFIKEFRKPGYTIECGLGENPLPITQFDQIYKENYKLLLRAAWGAI